MIDRPRFTPPGTPYGRPRELCQLVTDYAPRLDWSGPAWIEAKHDGIRALWIDGELVTRNGIPIAATAHWWPMFRRMEERAGQRLVIDGEWIEPGGFDATRRAFQAGGKVAAVGRVYVWDAMPYSVWESGTDERPQRERRAALMGLLHDEGEPIRRCPGRLVERIGKAQDAARYVWAQGGEGVVVKNPAAPYIRARTPDWLRIKRQMTVDCRVMGIETTDTGKIRLAIDYHGRNARVIAKPGAIDPARIVGHVVEVTAMEETEGGNLRQPRFVKVKETA